MLVIKLELNERLPIDKIVSNTAKTFKIDTCAIYCLTYRKSSITHTISNEKILDVMKVFARRDNFLEEHGIQLPAEYRQSYYPMLLTVAESGDKALYNQCLSELSKFGVDVNTLDTLINKELNSRNLSLLKKIQCRIGLRTRLRRFCNIEQ